MKAFPMFIQMEDRDVVILGGGEQAAQKCRLLLKTNARITVFALHLDDELADLVKAGRIIWAEGPITPDRINGAVMAFVASGCPGSDFSLHALVKEAGVMCNVVDQQEICDVITPSIVDRSPVVVAIGTEGTAPVLARQIKTKVEEILEPRLGDLAALAGRLRGAAAARLQMRTRRDLWRWVFNGEVRTLFAAGKEREAAKLLKDTIQSGVIPGDNQAMISILSVPENEADLMALKSVKRLQEADMIYYDAEVSPQVLELARRDAERIVLSGSSDDPVAQDILISADAGHHVVWVTRKGSEDISHVIAHHLTGERAAVEVVSNGRVWDLS
ncbi:MAG: siroheme synthase [Pseudomonadota bacterium]